MFIVIAVIIAVIISSIISFTFPDDQKCNHAIGNGLVIAILATSICFHFSVKETCDNTVPLHLKHHCRAMHFTTVSATPQIVLLCDDNGKTYSILFNSTVNP